MVGQSSKSDMLVMLSRFGTLWRILGEVNA
jgi:hypothetical protein